MMKKLPFAILCSLSTVAIGLSTWSLIQSYSIPKQEIEYTLYVGTNDKETYQLEMPLEEARSIIHNTMMDHFSDGFTMYDASGVWRDEKNVVTLEYSFVCVLEYADKAEVYKAADELIEKLNQSTILVVANSVSKVDFYTGSK
ncbi:MAG: DUF3574 domain-containing protein [Bacilli bacterium]|nr:DUF3574 domain-containing protein [Bacilli bacterium]